jgi:NAD(P)-dependent dehydrogenase (short-subunit alcohol dehydrogenase family)
MTSERKVVVITGASRGIGAQLSKAYRHIGYQVIASSRSMRESDDPAILVCRLGPAFCCVRRPRRQRCIATPCDTRTNMGRS